MTLSKYNDLMENIVVTEEMKSRILQNIEKELEGTDNGDKKANTDKREPEKKKTGFRIVNYRRWASVAAAALAVVALGLTARTVISNQEVGQSMSESPAMGEAAAEAVGAPDAKDANEAKLQPVESEEARENALSPSSHAFEAPKGAEYKSDSDSGAIIKELPGEIKSYSEISGDKKAYELMTTVEINGIEVTFRGKDELFNSAMWYDGESTFSVYFAKPVSEKDLTDTVKAIMLDR